MTQTLREKFKGSVNPGTGSFKRKKYSQAFKQVHQEKKKEDPNKHNEK